MMKPNRKMPLVSFALCSGRLSIAAVLMVAFVMSSSTPASAQLTREHLDKVRKQRNSDGITYSGTQSSRRSPTRHLHTTIIDPVVIDNSTAKNSFRWWSNTTGIPLVISWRELENAGIDPDAPIELNLRNVPASVVLSLMMKQLSPETPLMYEVTDYYIRIMTKEQANKESVVRVYDIQDLIYRIPNFKGQQFDLNSALSNTSSGGSSGGPSSTTTIFNPDVEDEVVLSKAERGEEIANLIRETIEPDTWQALGGMHSSVKYFNGRLIIKAPRYVHTKIGIPTATGRSSKKAGSSLSRRSGAVNISGVRPAVGRIGGVQR